MFVVWFLYMVFYTSRFGPIAAPAFGINAAEFPRRVGNLLARHMDRQELSDRLLLAFEHDYCRRVGLPLRGGVVAYGSGTQ